MRGVTQKVFSIVKNDREFQLTRLMRGVTVHKPIYDGNNKFQLTRLMRGVTYSSLLNSPFFIVSTHTPHARRDLSAHINMYSVPKFQLTRLMRGVTSPHS